MAHCSQCGETYPIARHNLGYRTCLECGDAVARKVSFIVVNGHKSNYMVISNPAELKGLNKYAQE